MSIWDYVFDNRYRRRFDIETLKTDRQIHAARIYDQTADLKARVEALEGDLGSLALLCRSLIAMLRTKDVWDEEEFRTLCREIDLEDGKEDCRAPLTGPPKKTQLP